SYCVFSGEGDADDAATEVPTWISKIPRNHAGRATPALKLARRPAVGTPWGLLGDQGKTDVMGKRMTLLLDKA
ncbi:hypothetical protein THAOC_26323, partial [Thalassiosira oceanica]